jgi:hypothetical protein
MLAGAIMLAAAPFIALFIALEGHGHGLTDVVFKLGGYEAIAGLVLGIPALGYAMVTDRFVEELTFGLGLTRGELRRVEADIDKIVRTAKLPPEHYAQVFVPNRQRTRLMPIYDPEAVGSEEGWEVNASTPQAHMQVAAPEHGVQEHRVRRAGSRATVWAQLADVPSVCRDA